MGSRCGALLLPSSLAHCYFGVQKISNLKQLRPRLGDCSRTRNATGLFAVYLCLYRNIVQSIEVSMPTQDPYYRAALLGHGTAREHGTCTPRAAWSRGLTQSSPWGRGAPPPQLSPPHQLAGTTPKFPEAGLKWGPGTSSSTSDQSQMCTTGFDRLDCLARELIRAPASAQPLWALSLPTQR